MHMYFFCFTARCFYGIQTRFSCNLQRISDTVRTGRRTAYSLTAVVDYTPLNNSDVAIGARRRRSVNGTLYGAYGGYAARRYRLMCRQGKIGFHATNAFWQLCNHQ